MLKHAHFFRHGADDDAAVGLALDAQIEGLPVLALLACALGGVAVIGHVLAAGACLDIIKGFDLVLMLLAEVPGAAVLLGEPEAEGLGVADRCDDEVRALLVLAGAHDAAFKGAAGVVEEAFEMLDLHGFGGGVAVEHRLECHAEAVGPALARLGQACGLHLHVKARGLGAGGDVLQLHLLVARHAELVDDGDALLGVDLQGRDAEQFLPCKDLRTRRLGADGEQRRGALHGHQGAAFAHSQPHAKADRERQGDDGGRRPLPHSAAGGQGLAAQVESHFPSAGVAVLGARGAGAADDLVQTLPVLELVARLGAGGDVGEIQAVFAGAGLIEDHAEGKDVRLRRPWPLRRHEALRADEAALPHERHEADVRQPALPVYEDEVGGLHIPVNELVLVQVVQPLGHIRAKFQAVPRLEPFLPAHLQAEDVRLVGLRLDVAPALQVVGELHHIIIKALLVTASDLEDGHKAGMLA